MQNTIKMEDKDLTEEILKEKIIKFDNSLGEFTNDFKEFIMKNLSGDNVIAITCKLMLIQKTSRLNLDYLEKEHGEKLIEIANKIIDTRTEQDEVNI